MLETLGEIRRGAAEPALHDEGRDLSAEIRRPEARRLEHHARETRRQRQGADGAPAIGEALLGIERPEIGEELSRLRERGARRRIEELEPRRIGDAPGGAIEKQTREIGVEDFGRREGWKRGRRGVLPQPIANSGADPAGAPASLIGGSARDAHRLEPGDADIGLVNRNAGEAAIDHDADIGEREARLGDRGREHELAPSRSCGRDGTILPLGFEPAVQRQDVEALRLVARGAPRGALACARSLLGPAGRRGCRLALARAREGKSAPPPPRRARLTDARHSASRPGKPGLRSPTPAHRREASRRALHRASPT